MCLFNVERTDVGISGHSRDFTFPQKPKGSRCPLAESVVEGNTIYSTT